MLQALFIYLFIATAHIQPQITIILSTVCTTQKYGFLPESLYRNPAPYCMKLNWESVRSQQRSSGTFAQNICVYNMFMYVYNMFIMNW